MKELRNFLELIGFTCWMDMGQIGGGELLYEKIDHGIRNAKVKKIKLNLYIFWNYIFLI